MKIIWEIKGVTVPSISASDFNFVHIIIFDGFRNVQGTRKVQLERKKGV